MLRSLTRAMACLAVALLPLSGAQAQAATSSASGATIQITDLANRTVRIPAKVDRILLGEGRLLPAIAVFDRQDPARRLVGMMGEFEKLDEPGYAQ